MKIKRIFNIIYLEEKIMINTGNETIEIFPIDRDIKELVQCLEKGVEKCELYTKLQMDKKDIDDFIRKLDERNYFEYDEISENDYTMRNRTNLNYLENFSTKSFSTLKMQKKISKTKVLLLGAGGASILAASLVGMGVQAITIVDYDKIEYGNLNRQFVYTEKDIGKYKVDAVKEYLINLNRNIDVVTYNMKITDYKDIFDLVRESDIVINAIDTPPIESTRWINYCCLKNRKALFQMGMSQRSILIESFTYKEGCYDCGIMQQLKENFEETRNLLKYIYGDSYNSVNTSYAPNILAGTGMLLMEIFKYILDEEHYEDCNAEIELDTYAFKRTGRHIKDCSCPTCNSLQKRYFKIKDLIEVANVEDKNR